MPVRRIVEQASRTFEIPASDIFGRRRLAYIVAARQAVCLAAYRIGWSSTNIGQVLTGRDHSTVLHARDRAWDRLDRDPEFAARFNQLFSFASDKMTAPYLGEPAQAVVPIEAPTRTDEQNGTVVHELPTTPAPPWCNQCESRVSDERAARCGSQWCSFRKAQAA